MMQLMMTFKFSRNAKVTRVLTGIRPVRPATDEGFKIYRKAKVTGALTGRRPVPPATDDDLEKILYMIISGIISVLPTGAKFQLFLP